MSSFLAGLVLFIIPSSRDRSRSCPGRYDETYNLRAPGYAIERVKQPDSNPLAASRYSCIYWVDHLYDWNSISGANHKADLQDGGMVDVFIRQKYLYWLEALSLCRSMSEGVLSIAKLEALIQVILGLAMLSMYGLC